MITKETQDIIDAYKARGWDFIIQSVRTKDSEIIVWNYFRSPRLDFRAPIKENFTENDLIAIESVEFARQRHGSQIGIAFGRAANDVVRQLGKIYERQAKGDTAAVIPDVLTISNIEIRLDSPVARLPESERQ